MNGEVIFLRLTDVGRSIDLKEAVKVVPAIKDKNVVKTKDTPSYVDFPEPLVMEMTHQITSKFQFINDITLYVKLYADGIISLVVRLFFQGLAFQELHTLRKITFQTTDGEFRINNFLKYHQNKVFTQIREFIEEAYDFRDFEYEDYLLYCITDEIENPEVFVKEQRNYISALLMGENPELKLSLNQINETLGKSFTFLNNDLVLFDFDRGLIIDPNSDYEDILLVVEIANYQLLGLRTLDKLLDKRLTIAEEDIRKIYFKSRTFLQRFKRKMGRLIRLQYDLIFLLENIENVSKLIGDYYLAQIYSHLSELFQLKHWSDSIRHRVETLENIYNVTQTNINEKFLLYVELLLSFIFVMEFIILIFELFQ